MRRIILNRCCDMNQLEVGLICICFTIITPFVMPESNKYTYRKEISWEKIYWPYKHVLCACGTYYIITLKVKKVGLGNYLMIYSCDSSLNTSRIEDVCSRMYLTLVLRVEKVKSMVRTYKKNNRFHTMTY